MIANNGDIFPAFVSSEPSNYDDTEESWLSAATLPSITYFKNFGRYTLAGGVYGVGGAYSMYNDVIYDPSNDARIEADVFAMLGLMVLNTSVGYAVNDHLSIGIGVDILYSVFRIDLKKGYNDPGESVGDYTYRAKLREQGFGFQGNVGVLYKFNDKFSMGLDYKTGSSYDLDGETIVSLRSSGAPFESGEKSDSTTDFKYAPSWDIGFAYKATPTLLLATDVVATDWRDFKWPGSTSTYDTQGPLLQDANPDAGWRLAYTYRVGGEWRYSKKLTLRSGLMWEQSHMPTDFEGVTTTTIGDIRIFNVGAGIQHEKWKVDYLVGAMWGDNNDGSVEHFCFDIGIQFSRTL